MFLKEVVSFLPYVSLVREDRNGLSMSPSTMFCAGNAAIHVFLTLCFAQREYRGGTPFIQRVYSAQAGEQAPGSQNEVSGSSFFRTLCSAQ